MNAAAIIDEIKHLSPPEQEQVVEFARTLRPLAPLLFAEHKPVRVPEAPHSFASADLAGTYELDEQPATNARVRESLLRHSTRPH